MTANVSTKTYTCERCGKVSNNGGNHGRHVAAHKVNSELRAEAVKRLADPMVADIVARNVALTRSIPKTHGGYRPGSGRKPTLVGSTTRAFVLDEQANARLERFRQEHGLVGAQHASEALRRIIAIAVP